MHKPTRPLWLQRPKNLLLSAGLSLLLGLWSLLVLLPATVLVLLYLLPDMIRDLTRPRS